MMIKNIVFLVLISSALNANSQESVNSSNTELSGSGGKASVSIGQVLYSSYGSDVSVEPGVQHGYPMAETNSTDDIMGDGIAIYPNPVSSVLTVSHGNSNLECKRIDIYDLTGKLVKSVPFENGNISIDLSNLKTGTYIARIVQNNNNTVNHPFVKS